MTGLTATLPPSMTEPTPIDSSSGASASDDGFSFHDLLNLFSAPGTDTSNTSFSLHDLVSVINPLQHLPIVSMIYRAVTGDTIKPAERIAGDTLYGGLWGFVSSVANVALQEVTGRDFGDTAIALLEGKDLTTPPVEVASNADTSSAVATVTATASATPTMIASAAPDTIVSAAAAASPAVPSVAPTMIASISPQLIATAPPAALQRQTLAPSSKVANDHAAALALMTSMNAGANASTLNQRALAAYRKSQTLPAYADSIPIY